MHILVTGGMIKHMKQNENAFTPMDQSPLGYEAYHVISERMTVTQYHCHDYFEFYLHRHGGQLMGVDNQLYTLRPNQLFILPPFFMHGLRCTREMHNYERAYLNLAPEVLRQLGCGQIDLISFFRSHASRGHYTYQLTEDAAARFVSMIRQIQERAASPSDPVSRFMDYSQMMGCLELICQAFGEASPVESEHLSNSIIRDVLSYINTHYTEPLSISELARMFSVSSSYLAHEFTAFTNRSIYNYILYRRIMLSRQQMLGSDSLNTIAYQCGFSDYSNFLRTFTKIVGMPPSAYRKQLQQYQNE